MDLTLNFTDRDSYLAWRKEWKTNYRELSKSIREMKVAHKEADREFSKGGSYSKLTSAIYNLRKAQRTAGEYLIALEMAKTKSWELRNLRVASQRQQEVTQEPVLT